MRAIPGPRALDRRIRILLGVCAAALALPSFAAAQQAAVARRFTVQGVLTDSLTRLAIPRGEVSLADGSRAALADGAGRFQLRDVPEGSQVLSFRALGYYELVVPVFVSDSLGALVIRLDPRPIPIEGLSVNPAGPPTVWGIVVDARSGTGIPYGTVWLRNANRTGVADGRGSFRLSRIPEGNDLLLVGKLGYLSQYIPVRAEPSSEPVNARLEPDSVVIQGVKVVAQQLKSRRNASPGIVLDYPQERIVRSGAKDAWTFMTTWTGLALIPCEGRASITCVSGRRGVPTSVRVFVDEMRIPEGLDMLKTYPVHEVYSIELSHGDIHLYTNGFIEQMARRPRLLIDDRNLPRGTSIR